VAEHGKKGKVEKKKRKKRKRNQRSRIMKLIIIQESRMGVLSEVTTSFSIHDS
jgi:hypothetical protein